MKKLLSPILFLSASLFILLLAIQCKPASGSKAEEDVVTTEESATGAESEPTAETAFVAEPEASVEAQNAAEPETKAKPESKTEPAVKADPKTAAEPEPKAKAEPAVEPKAEAKPEPKPAPEAEKKAEEPKPAPAAPVTSSFSLKSPKGVIEGTSNLHDWKIDVTKMECKGSFQSVDNVVKSVKNVEVKIPVLDLKSEKGKTMDGKTYEAFNSDKHPYITFAFSSADVKTDASGAVTIAASGSLSMAGKTKTVPVTAKGKTLANGDLQLSVTQKLTMSEFDMKSPTALMGTIKVGDEVTVRFDIVLAR